MHIFPASPRRKESEKLDEYLKINCWKKIKLDERGTYDFTGNMNIDETSNEVTSNVQDEFVTNNANSFGCPSSPSLPISQGILKKGTPSTSERKKRVHFECENVMGGSNKATKDAITTPRRTLVRCKSFKFTNLPMEVSPSRCSIASCKNSDSELSPIRSDKHRPSSIKISEADSPVKTAISNVDDEDTPLTINDCGSDQLIQPISNEKLITKNEPFMPEYVDNTERVESVIPKLSKSGSILQRQLISKKIFTVGQFASLSDSDLSELAIKSSREKSKAQVAQDELIKFVSSRIISNCKNTACNEPKQDGNILQQKNGLETETNSEQITSKINSEEHAAIDELPKNIESTKNIFHKPELSKPLDEIGDANKEINTSSANIENGIAERTADEDQLIKETGVVDIGNTPNGNCHGQSKDICAFGETENKGTEPAVGENLPQFSGSNRSLSEPTTTDSNEHIDNQKKLYAPLINSWKQKFEQMEVPTTQYELLQLLNITSEFHRDILGEILNGSNSDSKARVE